MKIIYNNASIFYTLKGKGPLVVFLHGFLEDGSMWNPILSCCKNKTALVVDLPGHGKSGSFDTIHSMEDMACLVKAILDKHKIDRATVVGHSMGGYVALGMADLYPSYITKLVLLNSTPLPDSDQRLKNRKQAITILRQEPERFTSMAIQSLFDPENLESLAPIIKQLQSKAAQLDPSGIIAAVHGMMARPDRTAVLKQFQAEKIIIASLNDPIINCSQLANISLRAEVQFAVLPGGHMSTFEQPDRVRNLLQHFLK